MSLLKRPGKVSRGPLIRLTDFIRGTAGNLLTWGADGKLTTVATGSSAQVLTSNGAGLAPTFQAAAAGGIVLQAISMAIAEATGTTNIPFDDTLPANTEGTEIGTQAIVMADNSNKVLIHGAIQVGRDDANPDGIVVVLFRGTTAIASRAVTTPGAASLDNDVASFATLDSPATAGSVTYSVRIGHRAAAATGTWAAGVAASSFDFGDTADDGLVLLEISA